MIHQTSQEFGLKIFAFQFVRSQLTTLENEMKFWEKTRTSLVKVQEADHVSILCYMSVKFSIKHFMNSYVLATFLVWIN